MHYIYSVYIIIWYGFYNLLKYPKVNQQFDVEPPACRRIKRPVAIPYFGVNNLYK